MAAFDDAGRGHCLGNLACLAKIEVEAPGKLASGFLLRARWLLLQILVVSLENNEI